MPTSEAAFDPPPPPSFPLLPPQAARVEATVAVATRVTRRRADLGNCAPLCVQATAARGSGTGERAEGDRPSPPTGAGRPPATGTAPQQADGADEAGRRR